MRSSAATIEAEVGEPEHQAEPDVADQVLTPGATQQPGALLHGLHRTQVARHQHRHDQERGVQPTPISLTTIWPIQPTRSSIARSRRPTVAAITA